MRPRLRKALELLGLDTDPSAKPPEPKDETPRVERLNADEAKRRLEESRKRLRETIPPPPA